MTYTPLKPDPGPSPKLDSSIIRANFASFATGFGQNHIGMNLRNNGDHSYVILTKQTTVPTNIESETLLFCKDATSKAGTQPQLFVTIPKFLPTKNDTTKASNTPMQLTYNSVNVAGPLYQSFLAGGYIIYFGSGSGTTSATKNVNTLDVITLSPAPTKILVALAAANSKKSNPSSSPEPFEITTNIISSAQFQVITHGNNKDLAIPYAFTFTAIGTV